MVNLGREGLLHGREERWVTEYGMSLLFFIPISFKQAILRNCSNCAQGGIVLVNPYQPMTPFGVIRFGRMLSVGAICFEDRFCTSRKGGTGGGGWVHRSA